MRPRRSSPGSAESFEKHLATGLRDAYRASSWRRNVSDRASAALRSIESFTAFVDAAGSVSATVSRTNPARKSLSGSADDLETKLLDLSIDLCDAAEERAAGVGVFIDELQDAPTSALKALTHAAHRASQRGRPFYLIGAGLPSVVATLAAATSYAERLYNYRAIDSLPQQHSHQVLRDPAALEGITWTEEALDIVSREAAGYPYFLQEFGSAAWNYAPGPQAITRSDALVAVTEGRDALDNGFSCARWDRATKAERSYLVAMADDGAGPADARPHRRAVSVIIVIRHNYRAVNCVFSQV